jgi:GTP-binding protein LepA
VSAKAGTGVTAVLDAIVQHIPPPKPAPNPNLQALAFDSWYDEFKGVVSLVALAAGTVKKGKSLYVPCLKLY